MAAEQSERSPLQGSDTPDYNALFGREQKSQKFVQKTVFGDVRNVKRFTWLEWVFVAVATVSIFGILAASIERLVYFEEHFVNISVKENGSWAAVMCNEWTCTNDFIFTVVLLLNMMFCVFYCYDGLFRERQFEMIGYAVTVVVITVYVIANFIYIHGQHRKYEGSQHALRLARLVLACVLGPVNIALALIMCWRMGYFVFTTIGSSKILTRAFKCQALFLTVQHFNLQVLANILVLIWAKHGQITPLAEKIILPILIVYMFVTMVIGWAAVLHEVHILSFVWHFVITPGFGYYVYKIVNVAVHWSDYDDKNQEFTSHKQPPTKSDYEYVSISIIVACCLGLIVYVLMVVLMIVLQWMFFGKGLKEKIQPPFHDLWRRFLWWYARRRASSTLH